MVINLMPFVVLNWRAEKIPDKLVGLVVFHSSSSRLWSQIPWIIFFNGFCEAFTCDIMRCQHSVSVDIVEIFFSIW